MIFFQIEKSQKFFLKNSSVKNGKKKTQLKLNQLGITNFFSKILKKSAENFDENKTIAENSQEGMQKIEVQNLEEKKGAIDQQNFLENVQE